MVSLYLCSSAINAQGESMALDGRRVSSKSPTRVRDGDEGVAGRNGGEKPDQGIFHAKRKQKLELVAGPRDPRLVLG